MNFIDRRIISKLVANDWNYDCLNWFERAYDTASDWTIDVWILIAMFSWLARFLYKRFKNIYEWRKRLTDEGKDWHLYDESEIAWRGLLRVIGLRWLIKKKYRDLNE